MKVGIFDSGIGGLSVLKSILKLTKNLEIFYFADTLYAPYGDKDSDTILKRCEEIARFLIEDKKVNTLIVACNTATSIAISHLRQKYPNINIIGAEPALKPAIALTKTKNIGVLATKATLNGEKYKNLVKNLTKNDNINIFSCPCVGLVEQIENNQLDSEKTLNMLQTWLTPMIQNGVDIIVLGCTHYPILSEQILKITNQNILLIHSGDGIAKRFVNLSNQNNHDNAQLKKLTILHTGIINKNIINKILADEDLYISYIKKV